MAERALAKSAVLESWTLMVCLSVREPPLSREENCCLHGYGQEGKMIILLYRIRVSMGEIFTKCGINRPKILKNYGYILHIKSSS